MAAAGAQAPDPIALYINHRPVFTLQSIFKYSSRLLPPLGFSPLESHPRCLHSKPGMNTRSSGGECLARRCLFASFNK